jgi:hypothetical protein
MTSQILYSTTTGQDPVVLGDLLDEVASLLAPAVQEPYCHLCHRATEHVAEHDTEVYDLGIARYGTDGSVHTTEQYPAWAAARDSATRALVAA